MLKISLINWHAGGGMVIANSIENAIPSPLIFCELKSNAKMFEMLVNIGQAL